MGNNEDYFVKRPVSGNSAQNPQRNPDRRITDEGQAPARRVRPQDENAVQETFVSHLCRQLPQIARHLPER